MAKFGFDHAYNKVPSLEPYFDLGKRGFLLDDKVVEHPGSTNRFIMMPSNPSSISQQYLEYSEISGSLPNPRVSLNTDRDLKVLFEEKQEQLQRFEPEYTHRNYEWSKNSDEYLPGWNYFNFWKDIVPGVGICGNIIL